jgi:hypothetical protein
MKELSKPTVIGTLKVYSGLDLVFEKKNKIKLDNFVRTLAFGAVHKDVANAEAYRIATIRFGSGGEDENGNEKEPDVTTDTLFEPVHSEDVMGSGNGIKVIDIMDETNNIIEPNSKIIEVNATISSEEANGVKFNELGLFDASNKKLTHICFDAIQKTENRTLSFTYQVEITVS